MILSSTEAKHLQKENIVIQIKRKGSYWGLGVRNVREGNTLPLIFNSLSLLEPSSWCSKEVELKQSNAFKKHEMPLERSKIEKPSICDIWRYCLSEFSFRSKQKELCSISIFLRTSNTSVSKLFLSISISQNNLTKKVRAGSIRRRYQNLTNFVSTLSRGCIWDLSSTWLLSNLPIFANPYLFLEAFFKFLVKLLM